MAKAKAKAETKDQTSGTNSPALENLLDDDAAETPEVDTPAVEPRKTEPTAVAVTHYLDAARYESRQCRHIDVKLPREDGEMYYRWQQGLQQQGATLQSGRKVKSRADALRWLMEQLRATENRAV